MRFAAFRNCYIFLGVFGGFGQWRGKHCTMGRDVDNWCREYAQFWIKRCFFPKAPVSRFLTYLSILLYVDAKDWKLKQENYGLQLGEPTLYFFLLL